MTNSAKHLNNGADGQHQRLACKPKPCLEIPLLDLDRPIRNDEFLTKPLFPEFEIDGCDANTPELAQPSNLVVGAVVGRIDPNRRIPHPCIRLSVRRAASSRANPTRYCAKSEASRENDGTRSSAARRPEAPPPKKSAGTKKSGTCRPQSANPRSEDL